MKILFVDDQAILRRMVPRLLVSAFTAEGQAVPEIAEAESKTAAVDKFMDFGPDVVITDYNMGPDGTGLDLIRALRNDHSFFGTIVMFTDKVGLDSSTQAEINDHGVHIYLEKPVSLMNLQEHIRNGGLQVTAAMGSRPGF